MAIRSLHPLVKWPMSQAQSTSHLPFPSSSPVLLPLLKLTPNSSAPSSIGFHTAYQLASANAKPTSAHAVPPKPNLPSRKCASLISRSIREKQLFPFVTDLGDLGAVKLAVQELVEREERLDLLVNNAAV